jgi:hypothetical protein
MLTYLQQNIKLKTPRGQALAGFVQESWGQRFGINPETWRFGGGS